MLDVWSPITHILAVNGFSLNDNACRLLSTYEKLLREWNGRVNLVSRRDEENIGVNHILHSLSILLVVDVRRGANVLDLGTGGGLPGIPLAIARPDLDIVLLDSIGKKIRAVDDIVAKLGIRNVRTRCSRAEDMKNESGFAGAFDVIVSRGVASLSDLIRWSRPLARKRSSEGSPVVAARPGPRSFPEPYLLCLKGGDLDSEIAQAGRKVRVKDAAVLDIVFSHGQAPDLEGKKLVVVPILN